MVHLLKRLAPIVVTPCSLLAMYIFITVSSRFEMSASKPTQTCHVIDYYCRWAFISTLAQAKLNLWEAEKVIFIH